MVSGNSGARERRCQAAGTAGKTSGGPRSVGWVIKGELTVELSRCLFYPEGGERLVVSVPVAVTAPSGPGQERYTQRETVGAR